MNNLHRRQHLAASSPPSASTPPSASYNAFLETYFDHVRETNAMFRTINDTLRSEMQNTTNTAARSIGSRATHAQPSIPNRHNNLNNNNNANNNNIPIRNNTGVGIIDDGVGSINGITFNIPVYETDMNIFNLLSSYIAAGGGGTSQNQPQPRPQTQPQTQTRRAQASAPAVDISNNTVRVRYIDIPHLRRTYDICPITRAVFTNDEPLLMMRCNHYFSEAGLTAWLETHTTCPICRYDVNSGTNNNNNGNNNNVNNNNDNNNGNNNNNIDTNINNINTNIENNIV